MREVSAKIIEEKVANLCIDANYYLPTDVEDIIRKAKEKEESPIGKAVFDEILENLKIAREERLPICQDCGLSVFFVELGNDVHIVDGNLIDAINNGVRKGYKDGYLRKSTVFDPVIDRKNIGDNTPAIIHIFLTDGDKIKIHFAPKGGGSENMSTVKMMIPGEGILGIKKFVVDWVKNAGGNPCPPVIVGIGIGGTFEYSAMLAKKALFRTPIGSHHPDERYAKLEDELLEEINKTGVGPMGYGGRITALAVHIETYPCHIASMPVAINLNCHAARHKSIEI